MKRQEISKSILLWVFEGVNAKHLTRTKALSVVMNHNQLRQLIRLYFECS